MKMAIQKIKEEIKSKINAVEDKFHRKQCLSDSIVKSNYHCLVNINAPVFGHLLNELSNELIIINNSINILNVDLGEGIYEMK